MAVKSLILTTDLRYTSKTQVAPNVYSFNFKTPDGFSWVAGQYAVIEIPLINGKMGRKPFSISSSPLESKLTITTRIKPDSNGIYKKSLLRLKKSTPVKLRGPFGKMRINNPAGNYAFLAYGIGITPFRSMLKQLYLEKSTANVTVFYAGNKYNHIFRDDFSTINAKMPNIKFVYIYLPERIRGHNIEEALGDTMFNTTYFLAGSTQMVKSFKRTLTGLGVKRRNIKYNYFVGLKPGNRK